MRLVRPMPVRAALGAVLRSLVRHSNTPRLAPGSPPAGADAGGAGRPERREPEEERSSTTARPSRDDAAAPFPPSREPPRAAGATAIQLCSHAAAGRRARGSPRRLERARAAREHAGWREQSPYRFSQTNPREDTICKAPRSWEQEDAGDPGHYRHRELRSPERLDRSGAPLAQRRSQTEREERGEEDPPPAASTTARRTEPVIAGALSSFILQNPGPRITARRARVPAHARA